LRKTIMALLFATGIFGEPQSAAVADYMQRESTLNPCASSWRGESLLGVAGVMRKRFHNDLGAGCASIPRQIEWLAHNWPKLYPKCREKFDAGDLKAFDRCWGRGASR
jgi:hypothetical protein